MAPYMSKIYYKIAALIVVIIAIPGIAAAQDIQTALSLFNQVAEKYGQVYDYSANVIIRADNQVMGGHLYWKKKSRLRIDFSQPSQQVLISNGELLQVYIPKYNVTLTQKLDSTSNTAGLASSEGLTMLRRGYAIAFKSTPNLQPLDDGAGEQVYKLLLTWKNTNQGFRQIELAVTQSKYIRRIEGVTSDRKNIRIDFANVNMNIGIPDITFDYNTPPESNRYDNFLFGNSN